MLSSTHAFCVAPMLDWTDRQCRVFHRAISRRACLYTEMITTGAILHGGPGRFLAHDDTGPVALQLGGSEPDDLAVCARLAEVWGYDEVNLNCGCPSERVQRGAFGACLMREPRLVADCMAAMRDACGIPVTVKHRIGLGRDESYAFVRDFVGTVAEAGCGLFIVHARNAWLEGLSPKENREIPPLRHDVVHALRRDFPSLRFVLNGGLQSHAQAMEAVSDPDTGRPALAGAMVGRQAYHDPWMLADADAAWYGESTDSVPSRRDVVERMIAHADAQARQGVPLRAIVRHMLGLYQGRPGARGWRRTLSDASLLRDADSGLLRRAMEEVEAAGERMALREPFPG